MGSISWTDVDNLMISRGLSSGIGVDYQTLEDFESFDNVGYKLRIDDSHSYELHFCRRSKSDGSDEIIIVDVYFFECGAAVTSSLHFYLDGNNWQKELENAMDKLFCGARYWFVVEEEYRSK